MSRSFCLTLLFLILLCIGTAGCQILSERSPVEKEGKWYGVTEGPFRNRWWNYYERGISFLDGGFWEEAEADFREALGRWEGDHRRIRTYGRHLINYFPHRELGIALYYQDHFEAAIAELHASLTSDRSARAEFYLDKARRALIEKRGLDIRPPNLAILSPSGDFPLSSPTVRISGIAEDDTFIKEIHVNSLPVRIDLAVPKMAFEQEVLLHPGKNSIVIEARDLTGKSTRTALDLFCDRTGPVLNVDVFQSTGKGQYQITGYTHDETGIRSVRIDERKIEIGPGKGIRLDHRLSLDSSGPHYITVEDLAGNRTRAELQEKRFSSSRANDTDSSEYRIAANLQFPFGFPADPDQKRSADPRNWYVQNLRGMMTPEKQMDKHWKPAKSHALIIGINAYKHWEQLKTAVNDANTLEDILVRKYGYLPENIEMILNEKATWQHLLQEIQKRVYGLEKNEDLLIYYAGHGQLDKLTGDGYWIPADGLRDDPSTWITHSAIKTILCSPNVRGKNILLITDSCYSGTFLQGESRFTRTDPENEIFGKRDERTSFSAGVRGRTGSRGSDQPPLFEDIQTRILELAQKRSRQVIASGGIEPVADLGKGDHSLFAFYFLEAMRTNSRRFIDIEYLFNTKVWQPIVDQGGQRPILGRLVTDMDDHGQFVLFQAYREESTTAVYALPSHSTSDAFRRSDPSAISEDKDPPTVTIRGWKEKKTVFIDQALIEMRVSDASGVQSVSVNGHKILKRPGRDLHLNYLCLLKEGDNQLVIETQDQIGNQGRETIHIHRKLEKIHDIGSRMHLLVYPLRIEGTKQGEEHSFAVVSENFTNQLARSGRFNLREYRGGKLPDADEQSVFGDAVRMARQQKVEFVLVGAILERADSLQISVRVIESDSEELLTAQDVYGEGLDNLLIQDLCRGLVVKLRDELPLIQGRIAQVKGQEIIINLGEKDRIKQGMHLVFFREGEPILDPETGESLGSDVEELGTARIKKRMPKISYAELFESDMQKSLDIGCHLIMK